MGLSGQPRSVRSGVSCDLRDSNGGAAGVAVGVTRKISDNGAEGVSHCGWGCICGDEGSDRAPSTVNRR